MLGATWAPQGGGDGTQDEEEVADDSKKAGVSLSHRSGMTVGTISVQKPFEVRWTESVFPSNANISYLTETPATSGAHSCKLVKSQKAKLHLKYICE